MKRSSSHRHGNNVLEDCCENSPHREGTVRPDINGGGENLPGYTMCVLWASWSPCGSFCEALYVPPCVKAQFGKYGKA